MDNSEATQKKATQWNKHICTYWVSGQGLKQWNCELNNKTCKIFSNFSLCTNCFMTKHAFLAICAKYGAKCKRLPIKSILQYWNFIKKNEMKLFIKCLNFIPLTMLIYSIEWLLVETTETHQILVFFTHQVIC